MIGMFLINKDLEVCFLHMPPSARIDCFKYLHEQKMMIVVRSDGEDELLTTEIEAVIIEGLLLSSGILVIDVDEAFCVLGSYSAPLEIFP